MAKRTNSLLGNIAVMLRLISKEKMEEALSEFKKSEGNFGEFLVSKNLLTPDQLEVILHTQKCMRMKKLYKRALGIADLAIARSSRRFELVQDQLSDTCQEINWNGAIAAVYKK